MPIILPLPVAPPLSPSDAGAQCRRARKLVRKGRLSRDAAFVLDVVLWDLRQGAAGAIQASYSLLCELAHMSRDKAAKVIRELEAQGFWTKIKRRVTVSWHQGGRQSQQATNCYLLHPPCQHHESARQGDSVTQEIHISVPAPAGAAAAAQEALQKVAQARQERILAAWNARH